MQLDIDECAEGTSGCSQECTNTDGNFTCSCMDGYELAGDGKRCNGTYAATSVVCFTLAGVSPS